MTLVIGKKALSLIELLVAITILSVGIVTALQALSISSRVAGLSFKMTKEILLTEDKMQEEEFKEKRGPINAEE